MSITVRWSDRLELLAEGLFDEWSRERTVFRRTCVVVRDLATRDWLKSHYLLSGSHRQLLVNLDFVPLEEFVNNWLFAKTHDEPLNTRTPQTHPYSKPVMAWRIYRILADEEHLEADLAPLLEYVGTDPLNAPRRRYALAEQIARLFDDYLNSRFAMLYNWEEGDDSEIEGVPAWQRILYQRLVREDNRTYARDYHKALSGDKGRKAIENGFPDYLSVHLFDISDMPEPTFRLLEKMAEEMKITFWTFNPCGDWLADTPTRKSALRELLSNARQALKCGQNPPVLRLEAVFENPRERLLGALGNGTRAVLGAQVDCDWVSPDNILGEPGYAFNQLKHTAVAVHSCYSPRRELEAVREGLHHFFKEHPDARPHDALVLCGDWENYAPIVEAVFNNVSTEDEKISIPMSVAGGVSGETPISRSFSDILAFRENRFEVSAVFALLGVPAIRAHLGLDEKDVDCLQDMVKKANIHWGLDDRDVNAIIGMAEGRRNYPFTWRRGLDRLAMDMLYGERDSDESLVNANHLGDIFPTGSVEGERGQALRSLNSFIEALAQVRRYFARESSCTAEEWQKRLLDTVRCFYEDEEEYLPELKKIRAAIQKTCESAMAAHMADEIPSDVFVIAVQANIRNMIPGTFTPADAVVFAPLKSASATPHRFIWICGLNDGSFPHIDYRCSFDVIGKHPSLFDVTSRDRDGYALLKAVLSAHGQLALSYVGRDIRSNERIPSSVLLNELEEYLRVEENLPMHYEHPLQAYSPRYFTETGEKLPPSYSTSDYQVACALVGKGNASQEQKGSLPTPEEATGKPERAFCAFALNDEGETVVSVDELAEFFACPNSFLIEKRLNLRKLWIGGLNDEDVQATRLEKHKKTELILDTDRSDKDNESLAKICVEKGISPNDSSAKQAIDDVSQGDGTKKLRAYPLVFKDKEPSRKEYTCPGVKVVDAYRQFLLQHVDDRLSVEFSLDGRIIRIPFTYQGVPLETEAGPLEHVFYLEEADEIYDSSLVYHWIRHVVGHAAGKQFATLLFCHKSSPVRGFRPLESEDAKALLERYLRIAIAPLPPEYPDFDCTHPKEEMPFADATTGMDILKEAKNYLVSTDNSK